MKKHIRFGVLFVLLALVFSLLASCSEDKKQTESKTTSITSEAKLFGNLPAKNFEGEEITILVEGDYMSLYKSIEIMPQEDSPEIINHAVENRNAKVEEYFNVKIKEVRTTASGEMASDIKNAQMSGSDEYDIVMPYIPTAAQLASQGCFELLNDLENIHLDQPYWDQGCVKGLSINNKNYFATGDFSLLSLACTHAIVFNKDVVNDNRLEDPYKLVSEKKWTLDKLREMAKKITHDSNGKADMQFDDTYGFLVNTNFATSMYVGSGERLSSKDDKDMPIITVNSARGVNVFNKIFELVNDKQAIGHIESFQSEVTAAGKTSVWQAATESVANKRVLFRAMSIADLPELGEYECNFGVLPIPMYDENQGEYYSMVSTIYASGAAIPVINENKERSSIILDAICQASTDTVKYNYYQVLLKDRKIQDNESEQMLDIIFGNRVYDLGVVYGWGGSNFDNDSLASFMNTIAFSGSNTFVSKYESIKDKIESDMETTIESFE